MSPTIYVEKEWECFPFTSLGDVITLNYALLITSLIIPFLFFELLKSQNTILLLINIK